MNQELSQWLDMFEKIPSAHLAARIFATCVHMGGEVPQDVMAWIAKEQVKIAQTYDENHPKWQHHFMEKTTEQIFLFPELTKALANAPVGGEADVFRKFTRKLKPIDRRYFESDDEFYIAIRERDEHQEKWLEPYVKNVTEKGTPAWKRLRKRYKRFMEKQ